MKTSIFRQIIFTSIIITISVLYFSCGDDSSTNTTTQTPISCVSGQITGWSYGTGKVLKFSVYSFSNHVYPIATCPIDAQGNFNMCLPSSLPDTTLFLADSVFYSSCPGNGISDPPDVRGAQIWRMQIYRSDTLFASLKRCNYTTITAGSFEAMYIYVNKNMTASGTKYCSGDTLQFNGSAVTGWNQITKNYTAVNGNQRTVVFNNTEPNGAYWRLTLY